jgi:tetratricopeptide (TPR) repeat protein
MLLNLKALAKAIFSSAKPEGEPAPAPVQTDFAQALALHQQGELDYADAAYASVLASDPDHFNALSMLGILAYQTGRAQRAVDLLSRAVAIDPGQPGIHSNLALALNAVGRGRDAIASCDNAIAIDPGCVEAHSNRGNSLWGLGRREEALDSYGRAIALDPGHAQTHWNEGFLRLQLGQFEAGWPKQEWRWRLPHMAAARRTFTQPLWLGKENIAGRTILLHAEQGLGDTIQFCRYARFVAALGATVVLEVQRPLKEVLSSLQGVSQVVAQGDPLPAFDLHTPLMSLPLAFNTALQTIPPEKGYVRCAASAVEHWAQKLGPAARPRVGIVWRGTADNKSVPLARMLRLVTPAAEFFSFQQGVPSPDQALLDAHPEVRQDAAGLRNFGDAPLLALMDLVVSVDTSVAHLAGAMGKPTWVPLPYNPDWRWLLERDDCPWYPEMRLFRQPAPEDWGSVVTRIQAEIASRFA